MSYQIADFAGQVLINTRIHYANANRATELTAIATALGSDTTTHDTTIQAAPAALIPGQPGNSRFTNDVLLVVNAGKAGNLTNAQMAAAITAGLANEIPPTNTVAPALAWRSDYQAGRWRRSWPATSQTCATVADCCGRSAPCPGRRHRGRQRQPAQAPAELPSAALRSRHRGRLGRGSPWPPPHRGC